jgi:tripartite-type tricarboxylate transporter receptor subunit TctC
MPFKEDSMKTKAIEVCAAFVLMLTCAAGFAQNYPAKPIRLIVPFSPGGPADLLGRVIGDKLQRDLGQPVIILNKDGAGTIVGVDLAAKSTPDGYTVLLGSAAAVVNSASGKKLPYDLMKDITPVSIVFDQTEVLVVYPPLPYKSVKDLIAFAKANPGKLRYGSSGVGSAIHLTSEVFRMQVGFEGTHVPYKGVAPALNDLIGGQIDMMFAGITPAMPVIKSGKVRPLGVASLKRNKLLPGVPTLDEQGAKDFEATTGWYGVMVPAGTPKPIIALLNREIVKIMVLPDVVEKLGSDGGEPMSSSPDEFGAFMRKELAKWQHVIPAAKIQLD